LVGSFFGAGGGGRGLFGRHFRGLVLGLGRQRALGLEGRTGRRFVRAIRRYVAGLFAIIDGGPGIGTTVVVHVRVDQRAARLRVFPPLVDDAVAIRIALGAHQHAGLIEVPSVEMLGERRGLVLLADLPGFEGRDLVDLTVLVVVVLTTTQLSRSVEIAVGVDHAVEIQIDRATQLTAAFTHDRDVGLAVVV